MPEVPAEVPLVPVKNTLKGRLLRAVLAKNEYDLYCETWKEWLTAHPEYNAPEDLDDLHVICMETVAEFRLRLAAMQDKKIDISEAINQSGRRKQRARENLTARRVDRVGTRAGTGGGFGNLAIQAGQITIQQVADRERRKQLDEEEIETFLEGTIKHPPELVAPESTDAG